MNIRSLLAASAAVGLVVAPVAATAQQSAPVEEGNDIAGAGTGAIVAAVAALAAIVAGIIIAVDDNNDDDLPVSP